MWVQLSPDSPCSYPGFSVLLLLSRQQDILSEMERYLAAVILLLKVPPACVFVCIFDKATCIQLISIPPWLSFRFARSCSFVVCLSLFSSLAWTNIFVRILFWVSLHVSTFPLPWSETAGETEGERENRGENKLIVLFQLTGLNPRHKCSGGGGGGSAFRGEESMRQMKGEGES